MGGWWWLFHGAWDGHRWSIWLFGKRWHTGGVYISSVDPGGQAEQLGVRPGSANCAVPRVLVCWHRNRFHWNSFGWVHWVCMASPTVAVCGSYLVYAVHIIIVSACICLIARRWQVFVAATPCYISPHEQKCRSVRRQARLHSRLCHSPESETGISEAMASYSIGTQQCSLQVGIRTSDSLDWRRNQHFKWNCWNSSWCSIFPNFNHLRIDVPIPKDTQRSTKSAGIRLDEMIRPGRLTFPGTDSAGCAGCCSVAGNRSDWVML